MAGPPPRPPGEPEAPPRPGRRLRSARIALLLAAVAILAISPLVGSVSIPPGTVGALLLQRFQGGSGCPGSSVTVRQCQAFAQILWEERLPELLLAGVAGAALGLSGAALQGVFRNPLADPYLLGLSSGGTLGAAMLLVLRVGLQQADLLLPVFAFAGALGTGALILVAASGRRGSVESLLLTGVALASFLSAALSLVLLYNPIGSLQVSYWLLGGVGGATWGRDGIALGGLLIGGAALVLHGRSLNLLQLGPDVAESLGVDVRKVRIRLIALASFLTAIAVAFTGVIGFVGLVSAHIVRRTVSVDYRIVLPLSAAVGGCFLLGARDLAEGTFAHTVLPVGIFTSFAGAPFFLYLLYRQRQQSGIGSA